MRDIVKAYVDRFARERKMRRKFTGILILIAMAVAAGVFWQLHDTGIALDHETFCGEEEHQHDENCYEKQLVCGEEETEGHIHGEDCYDTDHVLICSLEESQEGDGQEHSEEQDRHNDVKAHTHEESCYEVVLICELQEHTHSEECLIDDTTVADSAADCAETIPDDCEELTDESTSAGLPFVSLEGTEESINEVETNEEIEADDLEKDEGSLSLIAEEETTEETSEAAVFADARAAGFTVTWAWSAGGTGTATANLAVSAYLDAQEISGIGNVTYTSENDELDLETLLHDVGYGTGDYLFQYAIAHAGSSTYGSQENPLAAIEIALTHGSGQSQYFRLVFLDGTYTDVATTQTVTIETYYTTPSMSIEIQALQTDDSEDWLLEAELFHAGNYSTAAYTWSLTDKEGNETDLAQIEWTDATGRAFIKWDLAKVKDNDEIVAHVTVTTYDAQGEVLDNAEAVYLLEFGDELIDLILTYGPDQIPLPAGIEVTVFNDTHSYTGETDSSGWVHDLDMEPGIYTVQASYTDPNGATYLCRQEISLHDAGNYRINLHYFDEEILINVPQRDNWEHIDIKLAVGSTTSASAQGSVSLGIDSVRIYDAAGTLKKSTTSVSGTDNEFQCHWGTSGNTHSTSFSTSDTIEISYTLTWAYTDGHEETEEYTIQIDQFTVYEQGTQYPATGQRAYKLCNYLYGTNYSSDAQLIDAGITNIDLSGMSMMLVAAILCDSSEVTGAGIVQAASGQSANQWGLDFALSVEAVRSLTTNFTFDLEKLYFNHEMPARMFTFTLCEAEVREDESWIRKDESGEQAFVVEITNEETGKDIYGNSSDTMENILISYSDQEVAQGSTFYYILSEEKGSAAYTLYDDTVFGVKVELRAEGFPEIEGDPVMKVTYFLLEPREEGTAYRALPYEGERITFSDQTPMFHFINQYITGITLRKESPGGALLARAEFTLTYTLTDAQGESKTFCFCGEADDWKELETGTSAQVFELGESTLGTPPAASYTLTEVAAPAGYTILPQPITFEINTDHLINTESVQFADGSDASAFLQWDAENLSLVIVNQAGSELPKTGGSGSFPFTISGLLLIFGAAFLMERRQRRRKEDIS